MRNLKVILIIFPYFLIMTVLIAQAKEMEKTFSRRQVRVCIFKAFTDPDAFDPSGHFEIRNDQAPPFIDAANWTSEAVDRCLQSVESFYSKKSEPVIDVKVTK